MQSKNWLDSNVRTLVKWIVVCLGAAVPGCGQTAADLAAKYRSVSAYEIRPGVLMTAKYAADGQVCEMVLEARHYQTPEKVDLRSVLPAKLEDSLIDELVPTAERGEPIHRWSKKEPKDGWLDTDSYMAGGVSYFKRSYENVSIEQHGYYNCHENPNSAQRKGNVNGLDCSDGGDEVVVIRWTRRGCATGGQSVDHQQGAGEGKDAMAGGSPEGDGQSAPFGENSVSGADIGRRSAVTGQDQVTGPRAQRGTKTQQDTGDKRGTAESFDDRPKQH